MRYNKAFTLAEVMITMAILGILASILLPAVSRVRPNENKTLFKKAYYIAERMVSELVNDEDLYPQGLFSDTVEVYYNGSKYSGNDKFCKLFAIKLNTISNSITCTSTSSEPSDTNVPSLITSDGISWYMPISAFATDQHITVDVNGEKKPNCKYSDTCPGPDQFEIYVEANGRMYVTGTKEKEYLSSNKSMQ